MILRRNRYTDSVYLEGKTNIKIDTHGNFDRDLFIKFVNSLNTYITNNNR